MASPELSPRRVFGYVRVSSEGQADNTSLDVQAERVAGFVMARGWPSPEIVSDVASGSNLVRPGLAALRARLASGDAVVVTKVDRLSRSVVDLEPLLLAWEAKDISLHSVSEPIETGTAMGRALFRMLVVFGQAEREVIMERVLSGKHKNASVGKFNGGRAPYGYRRPHPGGPFVVEASEAEVVPRVFRTFARGRGGLSKLRAETGCPLSESGLEHLLSNPTVTGRLRWKTIARPAEHEAIVSDHLFFRAQRERLRRARSARVQWWERLGSEGEMELRCGAR